MSESPFALHEDAGDTMHLPANDFTDLQVAVMQQETQQCGNKGREKKTATT